MVHRLPRAGPRRVQIMLDKGQEADGSPALQPDLGMLCVIGFVFFLVRELSMSILWCSLRISKIATYATGVFL